MITKDSLLKKINSVDDKAEYIDKNCNILFDSFRGKIDDLRREVFLLKNKPLFNKGDEVNAIASTFGSLYSLREFGVSPQKIKLSSVHITGVPSVAINKDGLYVYEYHLEYGGTLYEATEDNIFLVKHAPEPGSAVTAEPIQGTESVIRPYKVTIKLKASQRSKDCWSFTLRGTTTVVLDRLVSFYCLSFIDAWKSVDEEEIEEMKIERKP